MTLTIRRTKKLPPKIGEQFFYSPRNSRYAMPVN